MDTKAWAVRYQVLRLPMKISSVNYAFSAQSPRMSPLLGMYFASSRMLHFALVTLRFFYREDCCEIADSPAAGHSCMHAMFTKHTNQDGSTLCCKKTLLNGVDNSLLDIKD